MPQLLSANGRRSGGRHIDERGKRGERRQRQETRYAGLVFEKSEVRPTSRRHFLASSSTRRIAAPVAPMAVIVLLHLLPLELVSATSPPRDVGALCSVPSLVAISYAQFVLYQLFCISSCC